MAREIQVRSSSDGSHYILFGLDESELSSFAIQLYITHYGPRAVDFLQALSLSYMSFMGGNLYIHNSDDVPRGNFFGEQKDMKIGVVANEQPSVTRILDSIGIHTDGTWEVESVVIPASLNYPSGMSSIIPKGYFKRREGVLYSEFLRNQKTSGSTVKAIEALTGEALRGKSAYVILKHNGTEQTEVQIWEIDINMSKSR